AGDRGLQRARGVYEELPLPEPIREVAADDGRHDAAGENREPPVPGQRVRVVHTDDMAEVQSQERIDRVDAHHHERSRRERPEEIVVTKRDEESTNGR